MLVHRRGRGEALPAQMTLVGFFARMHFHVFFQFFPVDERTSADFAVEIGRNGVAGLHRQHRLPVFVRIVVVHGIHARYDFVASAAVTAAAGRCVLTSAVVSVATVLRLVVTDALDE